MEKIKKEVKRKYIDVTKKLVVYLNLSMNEIENIDDDVELSMLLVSLSNKLSQHRHVTSAYVHTLLSNKTQ